MTKRISLAGLMLATMAQGAAAHPGEHAFQLASSLAHLLSEPDHLAMLAIVVVAGVALYRWSRMVMGQSETPDRL